MCFLPLSFGAKAYQEAATKALEMNLTRFKSRVLSVSPSTDNIAKRQATIIINDATSRSSHSPTPDPNAKLRDLEAPSTGEMAHQSATAQTHSSTAIEIQSRTIALMNVPDTINSARIRVLAENYGALVKIQLRPDHQGAIIEYIDAASAGKAGLALDGYEIEPNRNLRVGTVPEMLREKAELKVDRLGYSKKKEDPASLRSAMPTRRPAQPGARRGGRGGLGVKRGGVALSGARATDDEAGRSSAMNGTAEDPDGEGKEAAGKAKSNADFKAMFLKK